ncbi:MAG: Hsp70 family protein, partial [Planctomycetota bacterium]
SLEDLGHELATLPYELEAAEGNDGVRLVLRDRRITPEEVSAEVLLACRRRAATSLGLPLEKLDRAVITVPAYFDDAQRQATRTAARLAGLEVLRLVGEPTAAALAYGLDRREQAKVVVYDLGGGTFDVSVLELADGVFRVLSTAGDTHLGGDDFDRAILVDTAEDIRNKHGVDVLADPGARSALRMVAESVKRQLSAAEEAELVFNTPELAYRRTIDWRMFQQWIAPLVQRTLDRTAMALQDAGLRPDDVDEVVLVGGSTRVPLVKAAVAQFFGRPAHDELDPDQVVALGAAIQAGILGGSVRDALLLDVTPLSLGIVTADGTVSRLIERNSSIPAQAKEGFTTYVDGQTAIKFTVVQGERELAADNRTLGEFELRGIPAMPAGLPQVAVQFLLDADGMLQVKAREQQSGAEAAIEIAPKHGLTDEEVERMLQEAWNHAEEDLELRRRAEVVSRLDQVVAAVRKHEEQAAAALAPAQLERLQEALEDATAIDDTTAVPAIKGRLDELEAAAAPLAEVLMHDVAMEAVRDRKVTDLLDR